MKKREATYRLELRGEVKKRRMESFAFRDCNVRLALEWCSHFLGDFLFYTRNEKCEIRKKSLIYEERGVFMDFCYFRVWGWESRDRTCASATSISLFFLWSSQREKS